VASERMSAGEQRRTARSLEKSLESTCRGLRLFLETLERSGMREAQHAYREMQLVLLQQRLWARTYRRAELDPLWRKLAETAGALHEIFAGFAAILEPLRYLESVGEPETAPAARDRPPAGDELHEALLSRVGFTRREVERLSTGEAAAIERLVKAGVLEPRGWGRGRAYRLTPAVRRRLAAQLARIPVEAGRLPEAGSGER